MGSGRMGSFWGVQKVGSGDFYQSPTLHMLLVCPSPLEASWSHKASSGQGTTSGSDMGGNAESVHIFAVLSAWRSQNCESQAAWSAETLHCPGKSPDSLWAL